jgi:hypothetical protein
VSEKDRRSLQRPFGFGLLMAAAGLLAAGAVFALARSA